jgi:hypothetical protein
LPSPPLTAPTISAATANALVANMAQIGVRRLGDRHTEQPRQDSSWPIVVRIRAIPFDALIITANMLDTEATITGHFIHA